MGAVVLLGAVGDGLEVLLGFLAGCGIVVAVVLVAYVIALWRENPPA